MAGFICKQPNGLYCRFSTVVDCPTHYNMTKEDYLSNVTGTVPSVEMGEDVLNNYLKTFDYMLDKFQPNNMTIKEFTDIVEEMKREPGEEGYCIC